MCAKVSDPKSKSSQQRHERRQSIVETAARLFANEGYAGCEMEKVAVELGIAKGTLYLYFPGKQELFFSCVDWGMSQMVTTVRAAAESQTDPYRRLTEGIRTYLEFFEKHPAYVELLIQERAIFKDRKRPTYFEYRDATVGYWRNLYSELIATGKLRSDLSVERIVDTIGRLLYGTMFMNHFIGRTVSLDEQYNAMMEIVFTGMFSEEERQRQAAIESTKEI